MAHIRALQAVASAASASSGMMYHAPMTTYVSLGAAALGALYIQMLTIILILFFYHTCFNPVEVYDAAGVLMMVLLAWFSGVAFGLVLYALTPWFPEFVNMTKMFYMRVNMIASGKMFVANTLPSSVLVMFDWNPLFHVIDQCRGFMFINYNPHFSSISYPVIVSAVALLIGLLGEAYTRKHVSMSWSATR